MTSLSSRELECMHWAAMGKTSWEIGMIIGLAERTINFHIARACEKLGVHRRQAAVTSAIQRGLIPLKPQTASPDGEPQAQ